MDDAQTSTNLSIIVILASVSIKHKFDQTYLRRCLDSLMIQENAPPFEILVPVPITLIGFEKNNGIYNGVRILPVDEPRANKNIGLNHDLYDILRTVGLIHAHGSIIALVEDQEVLDKNWAAKMIQAHSRDFAAIGGAVENGINRSINWAVYFCDFINYQKPLLMEETSTASDVNISYKREFIQAIRSIWQDGFHEPAVHRELKQRGWKIGLDPDSVAFQMRNDIKLRSILKERFIWGRHFAARRQREFPKWKALAFALFSPLLPLILMFRKIQTILLKRRNTGIFVRVSPLIFLLLVFWASGELVGYITGKS